MSKSITYIWSIINVQVKMQKCQIQTAPHDTISTYLNEINNPKMTNIDKNF